MKAADKGGLRVAPHLLTLFVTGDSGAKVSTSKQASQKSVQGADQRVDFGPLLLTPLDLTGKKAADNQRAESASGAILFAINYMNYLMRKD